LHGLIQNYVVSAASLVQRAIIVEPQSLTNKLVSIAFTFLHRLRFVMGGRIYARVVEDDAVCAEGVFQTLLVVIAKRAP